MSWVEPFFDSEFWDADYAGILADEARTAREAEFIVRELALGPSDRVLDLACGAGRHALAVAPRVAAVTGFDRTLRYLDQARARAAEAGIANIVFAAGDMRALDYRGEFDAAWCYFTAWGYWSDAENQDILARVCRALRPGGRFLLEMIARDGLIRRFTPRDGRTYPDGSAMVEERSFDLVAGRVRSRWTLAGPRGPRSVDLDMRVPAPEEYPRMFRDAGFSACRVVAAPGGGPLTIDDFRLAAIGTK